MILRVIKNELIRLLHTYQNAQAYVKNEDKSKAPKAQLGAKTPGLHHPGSRWNLNASVK